MINIRTRLTYQFVFLVGIILLFFSVGVYFFSKLYLEKRFYKRLQDRAITTTTLLFDLQTADSTVLKLVDVTDKELLTDEMISVYDEKTQRIVFSTNPANSEFHKRFIPDFRSNPQNIFKKFGEYQIIALNLQNVGRSHWVLVSAIDRNGNDALEDLRKILTVMVLVGILLLSIVGWLFADRALAPMSGIVKQVKEIFPSNVEKRVQHPNRSDEIGILVATFNQLLDRIEQALLTQKMFIANVSHELKNPLTKIYTQIELTLMQKRSPEVYEKSLESLQEDTRTLTQLTNTLLDLANTVVSSANLKFDKIRMDELLWDAKSQVQKWHEDYQIQVDFVDFPEEEELLLVNGNEASLKVALMNLMDNACKFSPTQTAIVNFSANQKHIKISVANQGIQIPKEDLAYIFQPFYRSNATAQATKGHGVGLAIVWQIIQIHQAQISVESDENGTVFTLVFDSSRQTT
ncbi:MAG: sensor histidine kinase [Spirosomataceae bacterium]